MPAHGDTALSHGTSRSRPSYRAGTAARGQPAVTVHGRGRVAAEWIAKLRERPELGAECGQKAAHE
jgi:hypothetical protein